MLILHAATGSFRLPRFMKRYLDFSRLSPHIRVLWCVLLILSVMSLCDIPAANIFKTVMPLGLRWIGIVLASAFKASFLLGLLLSCSRPGWLRIAAWCVLSVYAILCLINFVSFAFYDFGISHKMLMLLSETNPAEAGDFFSTFLVSLSQALSAGLLCKLLFIAAAVLILLKIPSKWFGWLVIALSGAGLAFLIFFIADANYAKNTFSIFVRTAKNIAEVRDETKQINELMAKITPYRHAPEVDSELKPFNMVVVFGESADVGHLSLYGYPLPTTPRMDAMADSLFIFRDALASSKFTSENMDRLLTMKRDDDNDGWWNFPILIDILKAAGYRTFWISNQEQTGLWGNATAAISSRSDEVRYIGKTSSEDHLLQKLDEAVIPEVARALSDTVAPKWIGVHLMGSHFAYANRFPGNRRHFSADDERAANPRPWMDNNKYAIAADYDNSIRYTDSVVGKIIEFICRDPRPSILVYLSDHGENVYDDRDYNGRDLLHVRVPFVVFANAAYRQEFPDMVDVLARSVGRKFSTSGLPHAIMTLTGTSCPDYDAGLDFLSDKYLEKPRFVCDEPWQYE